MSMKISKNYESDYQGSLSEERFRAQHGGSSEKSEGCTTNTDKVDAEIRELRKEKEQLMAQLGKAFGDKKKEAELKEKITRVEMELRVKDNDTYRRQNAEIHSME